MFKLSRLIILLCAGLSVSACKEKNYTYQYLVDHPQILEKEFTRCQAMLEKSNEQEAQCKIVSNAVQMVSDTINSQRHDPEKFGIRILVAQMALNDYKDKLTQAEEKLATLKAKPSSEEAMKKAQNEIDGLNQAYDDKKREVSMLLGIMGMSTPE